MSELFDTKPLPCPYCGEEWVYHLSPLGNYWQHPPRLDDPCVESCKTINSTGEMKRYNRRSPPAELVKAVKKLDSVDRFEECEHKMREVMRVVNVARKLCELGVGDGGGNERA